jgi:tetratricopeptide (TPR) repeat protein
VNTYENMAYVYADLGKIGLTKAESINDYREGLKELNVALDSLDLKKPTLYQNKFFILEQLIGLVETSDEKSQLMIEIINTIEHKKEKTADDYQRWIYYLNQLKKDQELITVSKEMMKLYPEKGAVVFELSKSFFTEKKYNESLELITLFVNANPKDLSAKSNLGMLLEILGRKKEALAIYEEILVVDPNQEHTRQLYDKLKGQL